MPKYFIKHITEYQYTSKVIDSANQIMLHPWQDDFQTVLSHFLSINTNPKIESRTDFYGNTVATFMIPEPHKFLSIISEIEIITHPRPYPEDTQSANKQWGDIEHLKSDIQFFDFLKPIKFDGTKDISELLETSKYKQHTPLQTISNLCDYMFKNFKYIKGVTNVQSKLDDAWRLKAGVCQDFTGIFLQMVRMMGIPARYVSGYICPNSEGTRGEGATHAWIEAYIPEHGWVGFDPTNNLITNQFHVKLAVGRNYNDCAPVKGIYKGAAEDELFVQVKVSTDKNIVDDILVVIPKENIVGNNSYRQNLELKQQHQQQQQ